MAAAMPMTDIAVVPAVLADPSFRAFDPLRRAKKARMMPMIASRPPMRIGAVTTDNSPRTRAETASPVPVDTFGWPPGNPGAAWGLPDGAE